MNPLELLPIPLLEWYEDHKRDLPWREDVTPYRVWVSEIMLQQTRVAAVLGYFTRFMQALPTVGDLATVSEDELLKLWQGLGYYSRARNLQKAAKQIVFDLEGTFPEDYAGLRSLSGIGDYTAAAIASIAFGQPYPAVDGNLLRVVARLTADFEDITTTSMKKKVTQALTEVIPAKVPGAFNQAMMDLGATVCLPNGAPLCHLCPLSDFCLANQQGLQAMLPVRASKKARRIEERDVFLMFSQDRVALRQRSEGGLLAKLWEYPNELSDKEEPTLPYDLQGDAPRFVGVGRHIFSHVEWHLRLYALRVQDEALPQGWVWATREELSQRYAIPNAFSSCSGIWEDDF